MIKTKSLLIIGAGASLPYGYPTGAQLAEELSNPDNLKDLECKIHKAGISEFCKVFKQSPKYSIDAFLSSRGDDQIGKPPDGKSIGAYQSFGTYGECGKLALASCLIKKEKIDTLTTPNDDHWMKYLWNVLSSSDSKSDFVRNQLKIVSFNYDRVIEQYFQTSIEAFFGIGAEEASKLMRETLEIVHVYGNLQDLSQRAYGEAADISEVAKCIKVIPEARDGKDGFFKKAKQMISWADKICFIGFGFDLINIRRLDLENNFQSKFYGSEVDGVKVSAQ